MSPPDAQSLRYRGFNLEAGTFDPDVLAAAREWGANQVRVRLINQNAAHRDGLTYSQQFDRELTVLADNLEAVRQAGLALVLTFPQMGLRTEEITGDNITKSTTFWDDDANLAMFIDCWKRIATVCKGRDQIIWYDLANEPLDWRDFPKYAHKWPEWAQAIIDEIRKIDPATPIVIEPGPGGLWYGFADFPRLTGDPLIYSFHCYKPQPYTHQGIADIGNTDLEQAYLERQQPWPGTYPATSGGTVFWNRAVLEQDLEPVIEFQRNHPDVPIYVGEFSAVCWAPNAAGYLDDCLHIFEKYGWNWDYHCFRGYYGWSLEVTNDYVEPADVTISPTPTDRAIVVRRFLQRNNPELATRHWQEY
ncbi:MAG: glycoside hydrolase family 5 protein [bacterium]|nr:glycoside hydrolase family 5 protein [bacterium]